MTADFLCSNCQNNKVTSLSKTLTFETFKTENGTKNSIPTTQADIDLFVAFLKKKKMEGTPVLSMAHQPLSVDKVEVGVFLLL